MRTDPDTGNGSLRRGEMKAQTAMIQPFRFKPKSVILVPSDSSLVPFPSPGGSPPGGAFSCAAACHLLAGITNFDFATCILSDFQPFNNDFLPFLFRAPAWRGAAPRHGGDTRFPRRLLRRGRRADSAHVAFALGADRPAAPSGEDPRRAGKAGSQAPAPRGGEGRSGNLRREDQWRRTGLDDAFLLAQSDPGRRLPVRRRVGGQRDPRRGDGPAGSAARPRALTWRTSLSSRSSRSAGTASSSRARTPCTKPPTGKSSARSCQPRKSSARKPKAIRRSGSGCAADAPTRGTDLNGETTWKTAGHRAI